jgi:hypothetical protein
MGYMDIFKNKQACNKLTWLLKHVIEGNIKGSDRKAWKKT